MKRDLIALRKRRRYSEDFKKKLVKEFESGQYSVTQLGRLYGVCFQNIYNWIYKYSTFNEKGVRIVEDHQSSSEKLKNLEQKVKDLESLLGRKQIQVEFLEKLIELASKELQVDIKKNYCTPPSPISDPTETR